MNVRIETKRLILRPLMPEDYQAAFKWCGDPKVNKYMIYPLYTSAEDVKAWLETLDHDNPDNYDFGFELKSTGELIGSGGMRYNSMEDVWIIGYNLRADQWGNGYVAEAIKAIMAHISKTRKINAITGQFATENKNSKRVMEKLGMYFDRDSSYEKLDGSVRFDSKIYRRNFNKLVVSFPGIGYTQDMPLLYYGRDLLTEAGFHECRKVSYTLPGETWVPCDLKKMDETFQILFKRTKECLKDVDWSRYDEIVFLSKSIGTVMATALAEEIKEQAPQIYQVLYTPLEYTFRFHPGNAIAFLGTRDSHVDTPTVVELARENGIPLHVYEGANHSLETENVARNLEILGDVLKKSMDFIKNI